MVVDVANPIGSPWQSENIPDIDTLYMRVHKGWFNEDGTINPGVFRDRGDGMSTDWSKYSTPGDTCNRAKTPEENSVISMNVGEVRTIPNQLVRHTPDEKLNNRAHTDVVGNKEPKSNPEARVRFSRICQMSIHYTG